MKNVRRKGEWLEWHAPAELTALEEADPALLEVIGAKWLGRLRSTSGVQLQGRRLRLRLFPEEETGYAPEWTDLEVLYEDDWAMVVNKPAGMKVHPTREGETGTLLHAASAYLQASGQACRPRHVHRLDEDTTGGVLLAKNEWALTRLDERMRAKDIGRIYSAIVEGKVKGERGRVEAPIGRDRHHPTRRRVSRTGDPALTHYEVVERLRGATLVRLRLETGRTHQIRVHMSHLGHPLLGDSLYGGPASPIARQALHGEQLHFPHPFTGEAVSVTCPWPGDLTGLYTQLQK